MEVEMSESSTTYSGKKFEFCDIVWVIDNFCLSSYKDNWIFQTPEFEIGGFHTTRWVMTLTCQSFEIDFLKLSLKRCDSDPGPDSVWVDWRIEMDHPHCQHDAVHRLCCFRKGSQSGEELGMMTRILKALEPLESDALELHFKMIIFSEKSGDGFQECSNIGIRSLSEDLLQLYFGRNEYKDLELNFKTSSIKVHKIVACSRLKELNLMIEQQRQKTREDQSGTRDVLDLSFLNYEAMRKIILYAYSGELRHVLSDPSLFIYDCIQKFDLPEVKSYYVPHEFYFRTSVNKSEFNFAWIIPEKGNLKDKMMKSPIFSDHSFGTIWQLHLAPSGEGKSDYYDLRVESMVEKEFVACIECGLADDNNHFWIAKRMGSSPTQTLKIYDFKEFLSLNVVQSFPENTCLKVTVKIRLSDGSTSTCIEKQNILFVESIPEERCYYLLSVHMDSAYNAGLFSDLHLDINSIPYRMHKSIIAARSNKMHDLVSQMNYSGVNPFSNIEPSIFCMLLRFLYTGVVLESEFEGDFVDLYEVAINFDLMVLKDLCVMFLEVQIQSNLVVRARVLKISMKYNDKYLIQLVRKYTSGS